MLELEELAPPPPLFVVRRLNSVGGDRLYTPEKYGYILPKNILIDCRTNMVLHDVAKRRVHTVQG